MHPLLARWLRLRDHLSNDLGGGPRPFRFATVINLQKGGTLPFVLALMAVTGNWGTTAWVYAALHGSYGLVWLLKDRLFPDPNWEKKVTIPGALVAWITVLGPYWLAPWLLISSGMEAPSWRIGLSVLVYVIGLVLMTGADAQKYFTLKVRRGLITDGFFSRVRHPNYLGEMMLYGAFAFLSMHWAPWVVLAAVWTLLFLPNMLGKEASMARYPEWAAYEARTGFLLPRLWGGGEPAGTSGAPRGQDSS